MRFKAIWLGMGAILCLLCSKMGANEDLSAWHCAYNGKWGITHKLYLMRPEETVEATLLNEFLLVYAFYKIGKTDEMFQILKGIDCLVEERVVKKPAASKTEQ